MIKYSGNYCPKCKIKLITYLERANGITSEGVNWVRWSRCIKCLEIYKEEKSITMEEYLNR